MSHVLCTLNLYTYENFFNLIAKQPNDTYGCIERFIYFIGFLVSNLFMYFFLEHNSKHRFNFKLLLNGEKTDSKANKIDKT